MGINYKKLCIMKFKLSKNPEYILGFVDTIDELGFVTSITHCAKVLADKASDIVSLLNSGDKAAIKAFNSNSWELI